jgi:hypothetical protein
MLRIFRGLPQGAFRALAGAILFADAVPDLRPDST